ncbi:spore coat protein [Clostridiaceae bacterium UIB06]|uniref:Spore coat protein n=1 Tax=Clostridium thailandense TaxID=2794346 RepID=A0A949TS76_9CLOT|nr:spore coat protein [Clostridium thailandense]MBV7272381.1 spore coat protein [Clostridium thailandense]MCH5135906.1 spore coat protein [Clostridiaceae bacterium UIB06]
MYCGDLTQSFKEYLKAKGIKCVCQFEDNEDIDVINTSVVKKQICNITEFHIKTLGYTGYMNKRLDNNIGKVVEQYKIYVKRLSKQLNNFKKSGSSNKFENLVLKYGDIYLDRANKCINMINNNNYIDLILRSMKRTEMCLGNTYFNNLRKMNSLEIINIDNCCYNMVEMDLFNLLTKIKRRGIDIDFSSCIKDFCDLESLDINSFNFALSMISYPYEFVKCCNRYREGIKKWTTEQYTEKLQKAMIADGDSLI